MKKQFCCLACLLAVFALCCCAQKPNANACFLDDNTLPLNAAQEEIIRKKHLAYVQEHGGYSGGQEHLATIGSRRFLVYYFFDQTGLMTSTHYFIHPESDSQAAQIEADASPYIEELKQICNTVYGQAQPYTNEFWGSGYSWETAVDGQPYQILLFGKSVVWIEIHRLDADSNGQANP